DAGFTDGNRAGKSFTYTPLGETQDVTECVDNRTFTTHYQYDNLGRQIGITYPEVGDDRLTVRYQYTRAGYLHYVVNAADEHIYWAATGVNALGQVTSEYTRNGVETIDARNPLTGWLMDSHSQAHADNENLI